MHETFLAEAEAETEAFWPETEARPRRLKILLRRDRGEALEGLEAASRPRRRDRGHIPSQVAIRARLVVISD